MAELDRPRTPISRAQLCALLDVTPRWLDTHIRALQRDEGFPLPLLNRKYDPAAVAAWQNRRAGLAPEANAVRHHDAPPPVANDDDAAEIAAMRAAMTQRAAGRAP